MQRAIRKPPAAPPTAQSSRARTDRRCASGGAREGPANRQRPEWGQAHGLRDRRAAGDGSSSERNEVGKKPVGARHARGELPEPRESGIDKMAFPVGGDQQTAFERSLTRIVAGEDRDKMFVPF